MSLGLVNDIEFEQELERLNGSTKEKAPIEIGADKIFGIVSEPKPLGRGPVKEVPESVRETIAVLAINGNGNKEVADAFAVSPQSVSAYKNGATSLSTYHQPDPKLNQTVLNTKQKIAKIATNKLRTALGSITKDKIAELSPNKAAQLAKDMSAIVKDMTSSEDDNGNRGVQVVFYSPRINDKQDYEVIQANE